MFISLSYLISLEAKMKINRLAFLLVFGAFFGSLLLSAPTRAAEGDKVYQINMSTGYMERHPTVQQVYLPWIEEVKKRSNGRLLITNYNPGTICPEGEILESTRRGQIAIGSHLVNRNTGRLPISAISTLPFSFTCSRSGSDAFWNFYQNCPEINEEYNGIKVLSVWTSPASEAHTSKVLIKSLADLKGKKILAGGSENAKALRALGANPIISPYHDFYLSLSRNMADGCDMAYAPMRSLKVDESVKFSTEYNMVVIGFWFGMHQGTWDSLPKDLQQILLDTTGHKFSMAVAASLDDGGKADVELLKSRGHQFYTLSQSEREQWKQVALPSLKQDWFNSMKSRPHINSQKVFDLFMKCAAESEAKYGIYAKK